MAVARSGLTQLLADSLIHRLDGQSSGQKTAFWVKWGMLAGVAAMAVMSQNLVPVHIALLPPLLAIMTQLRLDRRAVACIITFGLVTTYMYLPLGFGKIFLDDILLGDIAKAGLDIEGVNVLVEMVIPAPGMVAGLLIAVLVTYRKPRDYDPDAKVDVAAPAEVSKPKVIIAVVAIGASFVIQSWLTITDSKADPLLVGALVGLFVFIATGVVRRLEADEVFTSGMRMMALIGFIMITAQGFASVMKASGQVEPLVQATAELFGDNKAMAAFAMLLVGLLVTMGIGSSFSTLPIITAIYVPLCTVLGFSPLATVSVIGTAGALGDAGSPPPIRPSAPPPA